MKPSDQARWQGSVNSWLSQGWASNGKMAAPAANSIWADTGQLTGGWYDFDILLSGDTLFSLTCSLQHRNAANNGNVGEHIFNNVVGINTIWYLSNYLIVNQERFRILNTVNYGGNYYGSIVYRLRA